VDTTTGISAEIVEDVVPQTSSPNPTEMPVVVYGCLLHLLLRGFYFSPTQMEDTWAAIGAKYPGTRRHRLRLANTKMIGSLQWQTTGDPPTLYHVDNSSNRSHCSTIKPGRRHCQANPIWIRTSSHPPQVPLLPRKARPALQPQRWGHSLPDKR
jgi:hypothetical protein